MISGWLAAKHLAEAKKANQFDASFHKAYDAAVYQKLGSELRLSYNLQRMLDYPFLFNMVVRKANNNKMLRETISCMFEDIDVRKRLRNPMFYFNLLFS
jgi:flavin-dependent dehydrogenase